MTVFHIILHASLVLKADAYFYSKELAQEKRLLPALLIRVIKYGSGSDFLFWIWILEQETESKKIY